jgi:hypothetical protein
VAAHDPVNIVNFVNFGLSAGAAWGSTNDMRPIDVLKDGLMPLAMLEQASTSGLRSGFARPPEYPPILDLVANDQRLMLAESNGGPRWTLNEPRWRMPAPT